MSKLRVHSFSVSLDGYGAGINQTLEHPMGEGGMGLHGWAFKTQTLRTMFGNSGGETGIDDSFVRRGMEGLGAWILGRNMFGPIRKEWPDQEWKGWWGTNPPYHCPVFVLTHYPRPSIVMDGGTVFHFCTGGILSALNAAQEAAGQKDIRLGGGVATIRQFLLAGLIDELHLAFAPVMLGSGESLLAGIDILRLGYKVSEQVTTESALHVVLKNQ